MDFQKLLYDRGKKCPPFGTLGKEVYSTAVQRIQGQMITHVLPRSRNKGVLYTS